MRTTEQTPFSPERSPSTCPSPPAFTFDVDELEAAFRQGPKALVLCNPSNPCGRVFTREELLTIAEMATKYDTYVITDEVYEHIVYAPHQHTYFATLPGMWNRTLSCSSLSKTYSITGWRLGYIIAPEEIIDRAKKVHDFLTVGCAAPLQEAVIPGLEFGQDYYDGLLAKYTHKKELFLKGLDDLHIVHNDPEGAYYVLLDISEYGYESDLQFCKNLAREVGVGAVPGSSFFREPVNHLIRLHFAKNDDTLNEALNRLERIQKLKNNPRGPSGKPGRALFRLKTEEVLFPPPQSAHNPFSPRIGWTNKRRGVLCFEGKYGGAGGAPGSVHHREPDHGPRRRAEIRHQQVHRPQGHLRAAAPVQQGPVPAGQRGPGCQQGPAAHPGRHRHPEKVPRGIKCA